MLISHSVLGGGGGWRVMWQFIHMYYELEGCSLW